MRSHIALVAIAVVAVFQAGGARAQSAELTIRADKGGYLLGERATITVANLTECAGQTVSIGFFGSSGNHYGGVPTTLDATGSGAATFALMDREIAVSPAVRADCVDRGLEPGLALDPHITLISLWPATPEQLLESLPTGAHQIAAALAAGDLDALLGQLTPGTVIKTAYPGDGGPIATDVAASELRTLLASGSGSDEFGAGRLGLLGVWEINGSHALLASTIRAGERHVVALGVAEQGGKWVISSYGRVVMQTGILETYALQHSVLLGTIGPLAPEVGNSLTTDGASSSQVSIRLTLMAAVASLAVASLAVASLAIRRKPH